MTEFTKVSYLPPNTPPDAPDLRPEQSQAYQILDLHLPSGTIDSSTPLLVVIHGGAWRSENPGKFGAIAKQFTARGLGVAVVGYRLSTVRGAETIARIRHPSHVEDVARGVAWLLAAAAGLLTNRDCAAARAVSDWAPARWFVLGHSAGAQIGAFLAADADYVEKALTALVGTAGTGTKYSWMAKMKGYIGVEGIYNIPLLVKNFPDYRAWFIDSVFGLEADNGWVAGSPSLVTAFNPPLDREGVCLIPHLIIHSPNDELVDVAQAQDWYNRLLGFRKGIEAGEKSWPIEYEIEKLTGKHEEVIRCAEFYDLVAAWTTKF